MCSGVILANRARAFRHPLLFTLSVANRLPPARSLRLVIFSRAGPRRGSGRQRGILAHVAPPAVFPPTFRDGPMGKRRVAFPIFPPCPLPQGLGLSVVAVSAASALVVLANGGPADRGALSGLVVAALTGVVRLCPPI